MRRLWLAWVGALSAREPGTSLALFRIAVGATILGELLLTWASGAAGLLWRDAEGGGFRAALQSRHWLFTWIGGPTNAQADGLLLLTALCAALVTVGLGTRMAAAVGIVGLQALFSLSAGAGGGHDRMFTIALFVLVFARSDRTLSLACRLRRGGWTSNEPVPAWPHLVITWNLALIYTSAGLVKLSAEWLPAGDLRAVYTTLLVPHWSRADWAWLVGPLFPLTQLATALTVLWESTFWVVPLWLALRSRSPAWARVDLRSAYLAIGVLMHGILWGMSNLGPFSAITLSWYLLLYRPEEWARLAAWWRRRIASAPGGPAPA